MRRGCVCGRKETGGWKGAWTQAFLLGTRGSGGETSVLGLQLEEDDVKEIVGTKRSLSWMQNRATARVYGAFGYQGQLVVQLREGLGAVFRQAGARYKFDRWKSLTPERGGEPLRLKLSGFDGVTYYNARGSEPAIDPTFEPRYSLCGTLLDVQDTEDLEVLLPSRAARNESERVEAHIEKQEAETLRAYTETWKSYVDAFWPDMVHGVIPTTGDATDKRTQAGRAIVTYLNGVNPFVHHTVRPACASPQDTRPISADC